MHKTLLKHKDDVIEFLNKEIAEAVDKEDLDELETALSCMKYIAKIVHADHDIRMDKHEMAMKGGNPGNPTKAASPASMPMQMHDVSTIDGPHSHGIASFTVQQM